MADATPRRVRRILLRFDPRLDALRSGKRLSDGMSACAAIEDTLWLAHDETVAIERLRIERARPGGLRYAAHRRFDLRDFVALPSADSLDSEPPEADLEGLAYCEGYLWIVGSHSARRDKAEGRTQGERIAAFARIRRSGNRFLLARVPVEQGGAGPMLVRRSRLHSGQVHSAARLPGGRKDNALTRALRDDPLLGPFMSIPSKDNGFDIEGLAAAPGGRLFVGLRGPVLDGWACVLEMRVATHPRRSDELVLKAVARGSGPRAAPAPYRRHLLDLGGAGIRDLCFAGPDLLILTGPPMRGKGTARIRRWAGALETRGERMLGSDRLPTLLELPYRAKKDHAEGIAIIARAKRRALAIVIYDSAGRTRTLPPGAMMATLHELPP